MIKKITFSLILCLSVLFSIFNSNLNCAEREQKVSEDQQKQVTIFYKRYALDDNACSCIFRKYHTDGFAIFDILLNTNYNIATIKLKILESLPYELSKDVRTGGLFHEHDSFKFYLIDKTELKNDELKNYKEFPTRIYVDAFDR